jgi:hypothetical protein
LKLQLVIARAAAAVLVLTCNAAGAQAITDGVRAFQSGDWTVYRSKGQMTDKTTCTGIYRGDPSYQISERTLYINVPGVIESVILRFGEEPAEPFRLATSMEKRIRAVSIAGGELDRLLATPRLRLQVGTLVSGIKTYDINLKGLPEALENIRAGCPGEAGASSSGQAAREASPTNSCDSALLGRMLANGVTQRQINAICR